MKRSFKFWLYRVALLLALGGAVEAQACCLPGRPLLRAAQFVGRVLTPPARAVMHRRLGPANRLKGVPTHRVRTLGPCLADGCPTK